MGWMSILAKHANLDHLEVDVLGPVRFAFVKV
jgi:hypothetical protein